MPALEPLPGRRVVATPDALDRASWSGAGGQPVLVLRIAPDEAFGIGATAVELEDADAIVEPEPGFVGARLDEAGLTDAAAHIDWAVPAARGVLAQGKIGGVPAKLWLGDDTLLVTNAAYAHELAERLGWLP